MLYLTTGANGSGKTLLTLRDVREKSLKENRPVCYNGRFELLADFNWKKIDFQDWQSEPDGTIFFIDECHNDMGVRSSKEQASSAITMLAEHRRRGFDFYLVTQHPLNIDAFVRRLIGSPGWHRHLKRASGAPLVSVLEWPSVNQTCEKAGSGSTGSTTMVPFPKEVYSWYASTSLDTAKIKIPFQVKVLAACLLILPVVGYYAYQNLAARTRPKPPSVLVNSQSGPVAPGSSLVHPQTPAQYVAQFAPRLEGLPSTSPRYDDLTKPVSVPFPAACLSMGDRCTCYTQQATKMDVKKPLCLQIVKYGFFNDWQQVVKDGSTGLSVHPAADARPVMVQPVHLAQAVTPVPVVEAVQHVQHVPSKKAPS